MEWGWLLLGEASNIIIGGMYVCVWCVCCLYRRSRVAIVAAHIHPHRRHLCLHTKHVMNCVIGSSADRICTSVMVVLRAPHLPHLYCV